jgi:hypothetical protein
LFVDPFASTHGRVDVNSERAADLHGRVETGQLFQRSRGMRRQISIVPIRASGR